LQFIEYVREPARTAFRARVLQNGAGGADGAEPRRYSLTEIRAELVSLECQPPNVLFEHILPRNAANPQRRGDGKCHGQCDDQPDGPGRQAAPRIDVPGAGDRSAESGELTMPTR